MNRTLTTLLVTLTVISLVELPSYPSARTERSADVHNLQEKLPSPSPLPSPKSQSLRHSYAGSRAGTSSQPVTDTIELPGFEGSSVVGPEEYLNNGQGSAERS